MDWIKLTSGEELNELISRSHEQPQVIYKHSLRCGTSYLVKENLEDSTTLVNADFHLLDLINFRSVSNQVSDLFRIRHESPQVLVIKNGICVYSKAHIGIKMTGIENAIATVEI